MHFIANTVYQYCLILDIKFKNILSSTGQVNGDPSPVFVLG